VQEAKAFARSCFFNGPKQPIYVEVEVIPLGDGNKT